MKYWLQFPVLHEKSQLSPAGGVTKHKGFLPVIHKAAAYQGMLASCALHFCVKMLRFESEQQINTIDLHISFPRFCIWGFFHAGK